MNKISVHVLYEHSGDLKPHGCSYIRLLLPLSHNSIQEAFTITSGETYAPADVVVVERTWKPGLAYEEAVALIQQARKDSACLLYSIDDNLLDIPHLAQRTRAIVRLFCREADGVLVSTESLMRRLEHINPRIYTLPNALDEHLFAPEGQRSPPLTPNGRLVIGYMGTFTHDADLMLTLQGLRSFLRRAPRPVDLQIVGGFSNPALLKSFDDLPVRVLRVPVAEIEYPRFIPWIRKNLTWHIGIAPLEDTQFNVSKSDIKFLDYSALGIAGIYSRVPSYMHTIQHGMTGYLVENTPRAWYEALMELASADEARLQMATAAQTYVFSRRTLEHCALEWRDALWAVLRGDR